MTYKSILSLMLMLGALSVQAATLYMYPSNAVLLTLTDDLGWTNKADWSVTNSWGSVTGEGATYLPSSTGVVVNASEYKKYIMSLSTNIVMQAPTNAVAGRSLQWSITAVGTNRWVTWPTNSFKIPTSSTMSNSVEIVKDTESIFVIEYRTNAPNWKLESYIWGY